MSVRFSKRNYLLLGILIGIAAPMLSLLAEAAEPQNPVKANLTVDYAFGVAWAMLLAAALLMMPLRRTDKKVLLNLWIARCAVTLGFMLIYEKLYRIDSYAYFGVSVQPAFDWGSVHFGRSTELVAGLMWLQNRLLPDSFHALKVSFSLVGLAAVYLFYRAAVRFTGREDTRLLYILGLFPSILFWSSTLGKDPIALFGIALYTYGVVSWQRTRLMRYLLPLAAGVFIATAIRLWLAPILLIPLSVLVLLGIRGVLQRTAFALLTSIAVFVAVRSFMHSFLIGSVDQLVHAASVVSQLWAEGGSAQKYALQFTGLPSLLAFLPRGIFAALFRPLPGEIMNPFGLLAGAENLLLLSLTCIALLRFRWRSLRDPLVVWSIALMLSWSTFYAFISYQNLGTASRFKLQILPMLLLLLLYLSSRRTAEAQQPVAAGITSPVQV